MRKWRKPRSPAAAVASRCRAGAGRRARLIRSNRPRFAPQRGRAGRGPPRRPCPEAGSGAALSSLPPQHHRHTGPACPRLRAGKPRPSPERRGGPGSGEPVPARAGRAGPGGRARSPPTSRPLLVMPGLVPGISIGAIAAAEMDARNKSGHDEGGARFSPLPLGGRGRGRASRRGRAFAGLCPPPRRTRRTIRMAALAPPFPLAR